MLDSVKNHITIDAYKNIEAVCGVPDDHATPAAQAHYVVALMQELSRYCPPNEVSAIMRPCGHRCVSKHTIETAKKLYTDSADLPDFLRRLNERRIGGGHLHIEGDHSSAFTTAVIVGWPKAQNIYHRTIVSVPPDGLKNCFQSYWAKMSRSRGAAQSLAAHVNVPLKSDGRNAYDRTAQPAAAG